MSNRYFSLRRYSEGKAMVKCTLHEYEHIKELFELLSRKGGEKAWKAHQAEMKSKQRLHILTIALVRHKNEPRGH